MSQKNDLAKEINALRQEIRLLEVKRSRSQATIIESLIAREPLDDEEVQFFRTFSAEIEVKRERLQQFTRQLDALNKA